MVRILVPSPLRHRLRKREIQILQSRLERLNRIPVRRMGICFTGRILEIPRCRPRVTMRRVRIVSTVYASGMGAVHTMRAVRAVCPVYTV
jgi:hypothetical protein